MHFYAPTGDMVDVNILWPQLKETEKITEALKFGLMPSITTLFNVIRHPHLETWYRKISVQHFIQNGDLQAAIACEQTESSELGTKLHDAVENFLLSGMTLFPEGLTDHELKLLAPFVKWARANIENVLACERSFGSTILGYGGTMDLAFFSKDGHYVTADFKFKKHSTKFPMKGSVEYGCQLSGYETHFEPILNTENRPKKRQNFLLNSALGYSTTPTLKIVSYQHDFQPLMVMIQNLWHAIFNPKPTQWWDEKVIEGADLTCLEGLIKKLPKAKKVDFSKFPTT
jgi:hypothetical protein